MTKIRSQEQLIDAAAKVFAEKGYEAARVEDVAAELGVLQGSIYYHVGSKAALHRLVRVRRFKTISDRVEEIADGTGTTRDKLQRAVVAHLHHIDTYLAESPQWFNVPRDPRKTPEESAEDAALTAHYRRIWRSILLEGIDAGELRADLDVSVSVLTILGALNWTALWYEREGRRSIDDIAASQFDLLWAGVAAPPS
jgi:AcrR family transcriptional regulator